MSAVDTVYVREREGVYFIGDTRVTLHSLIAAWQNEGYTAEELREGFPAISLSQVYGAIAYYLDHQPALDRVFRADIVRYWQQRTDDQETAPDFYQQLAQRKTRLQRSSFPGTPDVHGSV